MKKIVIVTRRMVIGGIERALISMLHALPKEDYEITVLVMGYGGELETEIPDHVQFRCLYGEEQTTLERVWNFLKKGRFIQILKIGGYTILAKKSESVFQQELYHSKMLPIQKTEYDLAIAYHVPASLPVVYVVNNIKAKVKAAWIHSDVSQYEVPLKRYASFYSEYDRIYCVSHYAMNKFIEMYPHLKEKTKVFYNIMDDSELNKKSLLNEGFTDDFEGIRIMTIGRITKEKGQDLIPGIVSKIKSEGFNLKWYCIGDGEERGKLEKLISKFNIEDSVVLLGTINNPYPYLKQSDIYVQPSRHEGYCLTLAEARAFNLPIITTDSVGAREQIEHGKNGLITRFDEEEVFAALKQLITNPRLGFQFREELKAQNISTTSEIRKIDECFI